MASYIPQPGDRVAVITSGYASQERLLEAIAAAPVVVVLRQHPHDNPPSFELSDGTLQPAAALQLVERPDPASLKLEAYSVNSKDAKGNDIEIQHVRVAHPAAKAK